MSSGELPPSAPIVDERGGVGIRLKRAAAIVRQYGEQFRAPRRQRGLGHRNRRPCSEWQWRLSSFLHLTQRLTF
jgi:hypothetical protein